MAGKKDSFMDRLDIFLRSYGGDVMREVWIYKDSAHLFHTSLWLGLLFFGLGMFYQWTWGLSGLVAGFAGPSFVLYWSNSRDNEAILQDLKWIYEAISVQLQSGLYILQALVESENFIRNRRMKKSFHRLCEQLLNGESIETSLETFEHSFHNPYISSFCVILRQMQDSGYAVKLLEDISLQLEEMERANLVKEKENLEMKLQIFQMLLFVGILVLVLYGCVVAVVQNIYF
ncbi:MAG: type II secretion system F family protein [Lachnospiraceae bacterium]|nr:type II secretion system F family protein [Lachnospiraceae bacterium]